MGAGGYQDGYPVIGYVAQFAEQNRKDGSRGDGAGNVADGDGHGLRAADKLSERKRVNWVEERVKDGGTGIGERGGVCRFDDRGPVGGEVDDQALGAVCQFNAQLRVSRMPRKKSYVIYMLPLGRRG